MESISVRKRDAAHGQACRSQAFGLETYGSPWTQFFKGGGAGSPGHVAAAALSRESQGADRRNDAGPLRLMDFD
jgi:hypothetical protein